MQSDRSSPPYTDAPQPGFLEICADSLASARAAVEGGADQIELCAALALGGLTPSAGLAESVVALARPAGVAVRAMVRPRAGGFGYDADDLAVAVAEARALLAAGVDGLVFGAVRGDRLDATALRVWREVGPTAAATLHRAIDTVADPVAAVDTAIALGFDQILTSGAGRSAVEGAATIAAMVDRARGRCRIVAGAGVRPGNVATLAATGVRAIHSSARMPVRPPEAPDPFGFGVPSPPADLSMVCALRDAIDKSNI